MGAEARLFKYGSGTGPTAATWRRWQPVRWRQIIWLMSFLKIATVRPERLNPAVLQGAAKMVTVDIDHPDIEEYIDWKVVEEQKVAALVAGPKLAQKHMTAVMAACVDTDGPDEDARSTRNRMRL